MAKIKNPAEGKLSARINLALPVKLADDLKTIAFFDKISTNELIKSICAAYVETRADDLNEYQKFLEKFLKKIEGSVDSE